MIGLEGRISLIESHMKDFSTAELEVMHAKHRQVGVTCLQYEDFKKTDYGRSKLGLPP